MKGRQVSQTLMLAVAGVVLAALIVALVRFTSDRGAAGPRRVWSPEHGHYHDVP